MLGWWVAETLKESISFCHSRSMQETEMNPQSDEPERLFLSARSAASSRHVILEDDGYGVWFYLSSGTDTKPVADCFLYSVVLPTEELVAPYGRKGPPILMRRFASEVAFQPDVPANAHRFEFSADGHAVVVFVRGEPWAFVSHDDHRGYSKSISFGGPFGQPWDKALFERLFAS
jgi:hypothetical protein